MLVRSLSTIVTLAVVGCSAAEQTTDARVSRPTRASASAPSVALSQRHDPPGQTIATVPTASPEKIACTWRPTVWAGQLRFRPDGATFGMAHDVSATVSLLLEGATAQVEIDEIMRLRAFWQPSLFLAKPVTLGGFVLPKPDARLSVEERHDHGKVNVSIDISSVVSDPPRVAQEVPCSDLGVVPLAQESWPTMNLPPSAGIVRNTTLHASPDGPPVARIASSLSAHITQTTRSKARVVLESGEFFLLGFIPKEAVLDHIRLARAPRVRVGMAHVARGPRVQCAHEVRVLATLADERLEIGEIKPNEPFGLAERQPKTTTGFATIEPPIWLALDPGAMLLVDEASISSCTVTPPRGK